MQIGINLSLTGMQRRRPFSPAALFAASETGVWLDPSDPPTVFSDTAGTTPADWGDSVARINDQSPNERHAIQASIALRPLLGRAPVSGRRNFLPSTDLTNGTHWQSSSGVTVSSESVLTEPASGSNTSYTRATKDTVAEIVGVSHVRWAVVEDISARYVLIGTARAGGSMLGDYATFDLELGTVLNDDSEGTAFIEDLGNGLYRIGYTSTLSSADENARVSVGFAESSGGRSFTPDGSQRQFRVHEIQCELGDTPTAGQQVISPLNVTQDGEASPAFIRFDLSDDVLPTTFPDGGSFDVMLFGRQGSWIERDVTVASAATLNIGPTTITGGPAGLLAALGDIVGWIAVDRTLTDTEVNGLVAYHKARGAGDLLDEGDL